MSTASIASSRKKRNIFADRMVRDIIVQVSLVVGLVFLVWFCTTNYFAQGGDTSWAFWSLEAKVDQASPPVLPVDRTSSVASAFAFGLVNTLAVAFVGIFLATILGFIFGIMRLSTNVLISGIAQVYIEVLRNIPLAVQLLFLNAILITTLPGIGTGGAPITFWDMVFHNQSFSFPSFQFGNGLGSGTWLGIAPFTAHIFPTQTLAMEDGTFSTNWLLVLIYAVAFMALIAATFFSALPRLNAWAQADKVNGKMRNRQRLSIVSFVMAGILTILVLLFFSVETTFPPLMSWTMFAIFLISVFWANAVRGAINNWADDRMDASGKRPNITALSWGVFIAIIVAFFVIIGGPISIEHFLFNQFGVPKFGFAIPVSMIALTGALAIYTSSFIAEIVRAGIQAVNKGQREAAASLGLRAGRIMNLIVIPQALKVIVPPLNSQYMNLAKNSSLAFILKYPDLVNVLNTTRNNTGRELEVAIIILLSYLVISLTISVAMNYVNARVQTVER